MSDVTFNVKIDTSRAEELSRPGAIEALASPIVKKYAFVIEGKAKQGAPVLTGFLKNSIQAEAVDKSNWTISDGTEYGIFQELGTRFMAGNFFLTKACESTADKFFDELVQVFK